MRTQLSNPPLASTPTVPEKKGSELFLGAAHGDSADIPPQEGAGFFFLGEGMFVAGKFAAANIIAIVADGLNDGLFEISVDFHMARHIGRAKSQQIVQNEDLAVAAGARANADGRNADRCGNAGGGFFGNAFEDNGEGPRHLCGLCVGQQLALVALHAVAAQEMHILGTQSTVGHDGNARGNQGGDDFRLFDASFKLDGLAARLLEDAPGIFNRSMYPEVKTGKRHVNHDESMSDRTSHHLGMVNHFFERDGQRGAMPLHNHRKAVADENSLNSGRVDQAGLSMVVGRQHGDLLPRGFHGGKLRNGDLLRFRFFHGCGCCLFLQRWRRPPLVDTEIVHDPRVRPPTRLFQFRLAGSTGRGKVRGLCSIPVAFQKMPSTYSKGKSA